MTVPAVEGQYYPTLEELRDVYLRSIAGGAERRGLTIFIWDIPEALTAGTR